MTFCSHLTEDKAGNSTFIPDGTADFKFKLELDFLSATDIKHISIVSSDVSGNPVAPYSWSTLDINGTYQSLVVVQNGTQLNTAFGTSLVTGLNGNNVLYLYGNDVRPNSRYSYFNISVLFHNGTDITINKTIHVTDLGLISVNVTPPVSLDQPQIGPAKIGFTSSDQWNVLDISDFRASGGDKTYTNLFNVNGNTTPVTIRLYDPINAGRSSGIDAVAISYLPPTHRMLPSILIMEHNTLTTLDIDGLPPGLYSMYIYTNNCIQEVYSVASSGPEETVTFVNAFLNQYEFSNYNYVRNGTYVSIDNVPVVNSGDKIRITFLQGTGDVGTFSGLQIYPTILPVNVQDYIASNVEPTTYPHPGGEQGDPHDGSVPNPGPPVFVINPRSYRVADGSQVTFTSLAVGQVPITYQWYKNDSPIGGATSHDYSIATAHASDNASAGAHTGYKCVATNALASADSTHVSLIVS